MKVVDTLCSSGDRCGGEVDADEMESNISRLNERVRGRRRRVLRKRGSFSVQSGGKTRRLIGKQSEKMNGEDECAAGEIRDYLSKLHEIVPVSRKHKRLSRLQVLTNAIEYIRQLRQTLGLPPCISSPGQPDHHHLSSNFSPNFHTSQTRTNDKSSQEYTTKSEAHVWLVSMPYSPSYHHDNEPSSSSPSHPAIP